MKQLSRVSLADVQAVYAGAERDLWELVMGEQIHIGGLQSSLDLARRAGIQSGSRGVDLCCCTGAGMRFLLRFCNVAQMVGVDATPEALELGCARSKAEGLDARVRFVHAEATATRLPDAGFDFVWGEDAWCYVADKPALVAEAARLARPGGTIAFTDWVEGPAGLTDGEAERFMAFMKFPRVEDLESYRALLERNGCEVLVAEDTGRFAPYVDLYLDMLNRQLTYDALKLLNFDQQTMQAIGGEMQFMQQLAHAGKIAQGLLVARKR
ncbi:MAG: class I SAM-dependent methyltransferase [Planctomycetota bacterium]